MHRYEHYLPVVLTALTVLLLAMCNPKMLQVQPGQKTQTGCVGCPNYILLSLIALVVGMLSVYSYN